MDMVFLLGLEIFYLAAGLLIGLTATMAGIGGGVFMVPLFYFISNDLSTAIGTSKFIIVFISLIGTINYSRLFKIHYRNGLWILAAMAPSAYLGAYASEIIDKGVLRLFIALFILYYSSRLLVGVLKTRITGKHPVEADPSVTRIPARKGLVIGTISGLIAGITGTGGGAVNMPLFLGVLRLPVHYAVALSTFLIFPSAVAAAVQHVYNGQVDYGIAMPFLVGAAIGALLGPRIAVRLSRDKLRVIIGLVLLYVSLRMLGLTPF